MKTLNLLFLRNMPRWVIFIIDLKICLFSLILAYLVRFNFAIPEATIKDFPIVFLVVLGLRAISFYISKIYQGIIKYTSSKDSQRIFSVITIGSLIFVIINIISSNFINGKYLIIWQLHF